MSVLRFPGRRPRPDGAASDDLEPPPASGSGRTCDLPPSSYRVHGEPALDERALLGRIKRGDEAALGLLLEAFWRPLVGYAVHCTGDPDAARDVVQDTLWRFWAERDRWTIRTSLRAYLYRAVHNRAADERRREARRARLLRRHERTYGDAGATAAADEPADLPRALRSALEALPERRRQIFLLAHFHDLPYREIAEVLEISPQTVANQVSQALADLRRSLASYVP